MLLPVFKDQVIRGRRKCGWSAMVFGVALLESHRVLSAVHWGRGILNGEILEELVGRHLGSGEGKNGLQAGVDGRGGIVL